MSGVATGLQSPLTTERVIDLADDYASRLATSLPKVIDEERRRMILIGSFVSFLADVMSIAHE